MKALDKVLRGCAIVALVVAGIALWRAESWAASGPTRARADRADVVVRAAASRVATVTPAPAPALPLDQGVARTPARADRPRATTTDQGDLRIGRLLVARDVRDREPVDAATSFDLARGDKLYAFIDVRGATTERTLHVQFVPDDGAPVGLVALHVPPGARFRTWAFSRGVRGSGHWSAVVRDEQGRPLAQTDFDVAMAVE